MSEHNQPNETQIDLNMATAEELSQLPGIGPVLAARILAYRAEVGPFEEPSQVIAVNGIAGGIYSRIAGRVTAEPSERRSRDRTPSVQAVPEPSVGEPQRLAGAALPEGDSAERLTPVLAAEPIRDEAETAPRDEGEELPVFPSPELETLATEDDERRLLDLEMQLEEPLPLEEEVRAEVLEEVLVPEPGLVAEAEFTPLPEPGLLGEAEFTPPPEPSLEEPEIAPPPEPEVTGEPAPPPPPAVSEAAPPRQPRRVWRFFLAGILSALAGAFLALLVLWLVNGTLDYRSYTTRAVRAEAFRLGNEIEAIGSDLDLLRGRVAAVEELAGRVDAVQADVRSLQASVVLLDSRLEATAGELALAQSELANMGDDVDRLGQQVIGIQVRVGAIGDQLAAQAQEIRLLRQATQRFDAFLSGLRLLLEDSVVQPPEAAPVELLPTETPLPTATPEAASPPSPTPTLSP
jgi:competence ComEA-like helix-hairpin-helix protein